MIRTVSVRRYVLFFRLNSNNSFQFYILAFCKRGKELFRQLFVYAQPCADLLVDFESKLEKEEMISHKMMPGKR